MGGDRPTDGGKRRDDKLDETLEETFPASDSPANTVETGIGVEPDPLAGLVVRDRREAGRFEVVVDGQVAVLEYERRPDAFVFLHTEVPESLRRRGIGSLLARVGLDTARAEKLPIVARCPFVRTFLRKQRDLAKSQSSPARPPQNESR